MTKWVPGNELMEIGDYIYVNGDGLYKVIDRVDYEGGYVEVLGEKL